MKRQALVVGINRYPYLQESPTSEAQHLTTAATDAEAMACLLESHGNFRVWRFPQSLIDGRMQVDPKKLVRIVELENAIKQLFLPEGERIPDVALLYFAGHGFRHKPIGGILQGYLGTSEANLRKEIWGVSLKQIQDILRKSPVKQQIVLLDCCYSGELFNFNDGFFADDNVRFFVSASRDLEVAYSKKNEHGILTKILLSGLNPDHSNQGVITNEILTQFINQQPLDNYQKPIVDSLGHQLIYLTATLEKKYLLNQHLGNERVSSAVKMQKGSFSLNQKHPNWQSLLAQVNTTDLFLQDFFFIDLEDALPAAIFPSSIQTLHFQGHQITPLLPINPILLDYLSPEELIEIIRFQISPDKDENHLRIILELPEHIAESINSNQNEKNYSLFKDYLIKPENAFIEIPIIELFPNFCATNWQEYYIFYYDSEEGDNTFKISFNQARETHCFTEGRGSYQIDNLEKFPLFIQCFDKNRNCLGIILLKSPEEIKKNDSWIVGVDIGTCFTNIYINNENGTPQPLPLQSMNLKITDAPTDTRYNVLFEFFIPENFIPIEKPLPLANILTTRGRRNINNDKLCPIFDGRIYIPNRSRGRWQEDWVTEIKWSEDNFQFTRLFIGHLALHITALAALHGVNQIQWSLSYPSAFSKVDKNRYARIWQILTKDLETKTGINQNCPDAGNLQYFRSESLAFAQYIADFEKYDLLSSACILIEKAVSNISIWLNNNLIHQCSVMLGEYDLFYQFIEMNPMFCQKLENDSRWQWGSKLLDIWLRLEGNRWLNNKRIFAEKDPEFQGLIQLMAIAVSGLYYYIGTVLNVLKNEEKYNRSEISSIYIGGSGSQFLNWLAEAGQFDRNSEINYLFSEILKKASGFQNIEGVTILSSRPQDEIACGLVLNQSKLHGLTSRAKDPLISGETCQINGRVIDWSSRLELEYDVDIKEFKITQLRQLSKFLRDFHMSLQELHIETIKPLENYRSNQSLNANEKLWEEIEKELSLLLLYFRGNSNNIRWQPPFILGLKALLRVLGKQWAEKGEEQ
jgi:Caspase domain